MKYALIQQNTPTDLECLGVFDDYRTAIGEVWVQSYYIRQKRPNYDFIEIETGNEYDSILILRPKDSNLNEGVRWYLLAAEGKG